jgi:uncharacterized membrane protein
MKIRPVETYHRSAVKAVSYRAFSLIVDFAVAYFFIRSAAISASIVIFVNAYSTVLYYLHERVWAHIHWGHRSLR